VTSEFRLFTRVTVAKAKSVVANPDKPAGTEGGRGFAEWAMLALYALRIELGKSYRVSVELLNEMPSILDEIGLTRLPHYTVLRTWFARIPTKTWRAFLGRRAEKRINHAAIDSTGFDRDQSSRYYANRINYCVRALKVSALVDVETLYITDIHSTTSKKHDAKAFRDELHDNGIRLLIKHGIMNPLDHAHNACMDGDRYHQRSMSEAVFSTIKRTLGAAVRARSWWLEFREKLLKATIYDLRRSVRYP